MTMRITICLRFLILSGNGYSHIFNDHDSFHKTSLKNRKIYLLEVQNNLAKVLVSGNIRQHDESHGRTNVVQTEEEKKMINTAKKMIQSCNAFSTEEYCLQQIFGSQYFWNKWYLLCKKILVLDSKMPFFALI